MFRRSCSSNLDDFNDSSSQGEGSVTGGGVPDGEQSGGNSDKKVKCAISKRSPCSEKNGSDQDSFLHSRFDFLEPMMLGVRPEFPDWPDQDTAVWAAVERKAKSLEIPLSLRMIKKKLQWEEGFVDAKESEYCSVKTAFASMVYIIVELQTHALHMREVLCHEDLEMISAKVQKDMHSSFVWLFQQVFSKTPALMLQVMILLANFSVYSASPYVSLVEALPTKAVIESTNLALEEQTQNYPETSSSSDSILEIESEDLLQSSNHSSAFADNILECLDEMNLWNSMVDEAARMQETVKDDALDHDTMQHFVSPVSVEIEPDNYEDYLRTDLLYQLTLSREPSSSLLLCNYAQFLHLVAHDYDRAEECFKRAVQIMPPDAESLNQYASFLWTVRRDLSGAEERFLQALSVEPENSYYASRYANFLWSTGGEETCFPLNNSLETNT